MTRPRRLAIYLPLTLVVIALGLASRKGKAYLPALVGEYAGDILWGVLFFLVFALLLRARPTWRVGAAGWCAAVCLEFSQLYHAAWIDDLRRTPVVGFLLGSTFVWSDVVCITIGVLLAMEAEYACERCFGTFTRGEK